MNKRGFTQHHFQSKRLVSNFKPNKHKNGAGFTLIELSIVISIIALIALITIPMLANYQRTAKLRNEARLFATNLRYAQQLAITEQNIYSVKLFTTTNSYQIINEGTNSVIKDVTLDSAVTIGEINSLTNDTIQFNPTGAAVETGDVVLINTKNQTSTIEIKPSGYVQIIEQF